MIKNAFHFILKTICPDFFGHVGKRLDKKDKINYNTYIAQYLKD